MQPGSGCPGSVVQATGAWKPVHSPDARAALGRGQVGWTATLLCALQYLPAGVALGWTYEKADTIWAPILVHSMVNAVGMGLMHG